jgi:hypothetical protein
MGKEETEELIKIFVTSIKTAEKKSRLGVIECSVLDVCFFISRLGVIGRSMLDLPAMPLGGLGRISSCLGPVTMIIPPSFVMHGRRVFDVHLLKQPRMA